MTVGVCAFGLCLVGTVTAFGGGAGRDVLPGHYPLAWRSHTDYVLITIEAASVAEASAKWQRNWQRLFVTVDTIVSDRVHRHRLRCRRDAGREHDDRRADRPPSPCWPAVSRCAGRAARFRWQLKVFIAADSGGAG